MHRVTHDRSVRGPSHSAARAPLRPAPQLALKLHFRNYSGNSILVPFTDFPRGCKEA